MVKFRRRIAATLLTAAVVLVPAVSTKAEQVAPRPIERGEWYLGANASVERFSAPHFKSLELYKDNSMFGGGGFVTIQDPEGFLYKQRIKANEFVPGVHFGYGFGSDQDDTVYRIEVSANAFNRSESYFTNRLTPPADGFFVDDDEEVRAGVRFGPINGKDNEDGSDAGFVFFADVEDIRLKFKEYVRSADISLYFDDREGRWVYSRGVSFVYQYEYQKIDYEFFTPIMLDPPGVVGINNEEDTRFGFRYRSKSHSIGSRLHYSAGLEIVRGWSIFTLGRVGFFAKHTNLKGSQKAPCLTTCDLDIPDFTPGTRKLDVNDWTFAYDARMGFGTSARLGPIRVTAQGGGTRIGGWTSPREGENGVGLADSGGWGYYVNASADLAF